MHAPLALAAVLFAAAAAAATGDDFRDGDFVSDPSSVSRSKESSRRQGTLRVTFFYQREIKQLQKSATQVKSERDQCEVLSRTGT